MSSQQRSVLIRKCTVKPRARNYIKPSMSKSWTRMSVCKWWIYIRHSLGFISKVSSSLTDLSTYFDEWIYFKFHFWFETFSRKVKTTCQGQWIFFRIANLLNYSVLFISLDQISSSAQSGQSSLFRRGRQHKVQRPDPCREQQLDRKTIRNLRLAGGVATLFHFL